MRYTVRHLTVRPIASGWAVFRGPAVLQTFDTRRDALSYAANA